MAARVTPDPVEGPGGVAPGGVVAAEVIHPDFAPVVDRFRRLFVTLAQGGAALAVYHGGEKVVDVWAGYADPEGKRRWDADTMVMSFSTTKGVVATVVHRLADRGVIDYDAPVATYWQAFDTPAKRAITVRHLLSHRAGLHRLRGLVDGAETMLDHEHLTELVALQRPARPAGVHPGYHGITWGWLVGGLVRAVTGWGMAEAVRREVAEPLGADGLFIGAPRSERHRVASLYRRNHRLLSPAGLGRTLERLGPTRALANALFIEGFEDLWYESDQRILDTEIPAVNGVFTARSLAEMYGALANRGEVVGVQLLSPETVHEAGRVQTRRRDYVLGIPMRWRLGYHQAFTMNRPRPRMAFGHFGFGGSGAWADPETRLSLAFVTNKLGTVLTPVGDSRIVRLGTAAIAAARART